MPTDYRLMNTTGGVINRADWDMCEVFDRIQLWHEDNQVAVHSIRAHASGLLATFIRTQPSGHLPDLDPWEMHFSWYREIAVLWQDAMAPLADEVPPAGLSNQRRVRARVRNRYALPPLPPSIE